ncbi:DUF3500 domain-containing protein [Roseateles asaccharophilus]|uniref:DUF3500 domain-containing protein n=1 Tax=Roseateles asaccharophilus TaxID=582607 RepID=A0ABU2A3E6_9BURK|nr:DUF3500 domain-containing protein [Roseateles asaccharophilus]MDR7331712.1 hypothetical protein [Roseateles asaccharophilus]
MHRRSLIALAGLSVVSALQAQTVAAARRLLDATPPAQRGDLLQPFTDAARSDWHYTPRRRDGIAWKAMSTAQRDATTALLRTALNEGGLDKVRALMALEIALRQMETFGLSRDPENYAVAIYGEPGGEAWGWRIEGHHLSLHFSLSGDRYVATLPQFFGANPATVPRGLSGGTPAAGFRLLGSEEDLARQWLASLTPAQRTRAVFSTRPFGDLVSGNASHAKALDAVGLPWADMDAGQQAQVLKLIGAFADHLQPELAQARLARVRAALDTVRIGWAGSPKAREPHHFRIQGASFLIEFDNSGGNHIHSVWRDFDGDFGRDVLAEHYRKASGSGHRHGPK